ncbi:putative ring finger protein [Tripterygium wilfordii]|uniref:RING-type E3 ubiquitin transferase n=1 Tax=Tripterygium wilfordii TaxID=458696 RepID=A0A7J7D8E3_TRIWF|nr:RING-H2 finger protein ATL40-like [Tripterygium wilfordii]KAF5742326.1 putative ring finger protein [Tripterygium wilfordii]
MSSDDDPSSSFSPPSHRILLISIFSLLVITILVVILHFYSRFLQRRQLREIRLRRATLNRLINAHIAPDEPNYGEDPPKIGLNPSVIASLPRFAYKTANDQNSESIILECSICLGNVRDEDLVRVLPNCKHMFHVECIDMWLASNTSCPICRTMVEPTTVQPEQNELSPEPSAPPVDQSLSHGPGESDKGSGSGLRISSFRRMLSRDRSSRRVQSRANEDCVEDLERQ